MAVKLNINMMHNYVNINYKCYYFVLESSIVEILTAIIAHSIIVSCYRVVVVVVKLFELINEKFLLTMASRVQTETFDKVLTAITETKQ